MLIVKKLIRRGWVVWCRKKWTYAVLCELEYLNLHSYDFSCGLIVTNIMGKYVYVF